MRKIEFERITVITNYYNIEILDEELFRTEILEWFKSNNDLSVWCFDDEHFSSVCWSELDFESDYAEDNIYKTLLEELNIDMNKIQQE